jgi:hypothetical protein
MSILTFQIQGYWSDFEAAANFKLLAVRIVVIGLRPQDSA